jgi:hypothetical protein
LLLPKGTLVLAKGQLVFEVPSIVLL